MKKAGEIIKHSQIGSDRQQQTHTPKWSEQTAKLVLGLFVRLADLFGDLARARGLEIYKEGTREHTREFELWCTKLDDLEAEDIARGIKNLETRIEEATRNGLKEWPPSYAEFRGLCHTKTNHSNRHRTWQGLPKSVMTKEEKRQKMADVLKVMRK